MIPQFIQNCENKLYRQLNLRNEETDLNVAVSGGVATVPSDFKALKFAYLDESPVSLCQWVPIEELYRDFPNRSGAESPKVISRDGTNFVFGPVSKDGTLKGIYYAKQTPSRDSVDPTWYITNAPDLLLYGSLLEAQTFILNDSRIPVWAEFYRDALESVKTEQMNAETSMGQLVQRVS